MENCILVTNDDDWAMLLIKRGYFENLTFRNNEVINSIFLKYYSKSELSTKTFSFNNVYFCNNTISMYESIEGYFIYIENKAGEEKTGDV